MTQFWEQLKLKNKWIYKSWSQLAICELLNAEPCNYIFILLSSCFTFTQPLSHSLFRDWFSTTSGVYKRLGKSDYGQPNCTTDHIKTSIQKDMFDGWIYIGEVKEGTDDTPHGFGIRVLSTGDTQQLNDNDSWSDSNY